MAVLIIIRGPLGVGKTTIAKQLAEEINAKYFSIDEIMSVNNLDKVSKEFGFILEKNFEIANNLIIPEILNNLSAGKNVVVDGCFYHRSNLENLLNISNDKSIVFTLKAPLNVCIERDAKRSTSYGEDAAIAVYNLVSKFDYGDVVDATKDRNAIVNLIKAKINQ